MEIVFGDYTCILQPWVIAFMRLSKSGIRRDYNNKTLDKCQNSTVMALLPSIK